MILDEATSALDPKSEKEVQDAIDHIARNSDYKLTIIMIAHRLQTILTADNLLYMESPTNIIGAAKGTQEYTTIINRLQEQNYAHQKDAVEKELETKKKSDNSNENTNERKNSDNSGEDS